MPASPGRGRSPRKTATPAIPSVGMYRTEDHEYYWNGKGPLPGVTTPMKMYDRSGALMTWAKNETASFALRHLDILVAHRLHNQPVPECVPCQKARGPFDGTRAAKYWVASISDYKRDVAADLGTEIHAIAEAIGGEAEREVDPALIPYGETYQEFLYEWQPDILEIEYMGWNDMYGFAGTGDLIARLRRTGHELDGKVTAIDIKSWTKEEPIKDTYYPETAMQLAACTNFDFIGKVGDPTEYPLPKVEAYAVLLLGAEEYRLIPYSVTDRTFQAFLACLNLYQWKNSEAKTIVGTAA
jgi:hypothetical protein